MSGNWNISGDTISLFLKNSTRTFLIEDSKLTEFEIKDGKIVVSIAYLNKKK